MIKPINIMITSLVSYKADLITDPMDDYNTKVKGCIYVRHNSDKDPTVQIRKKIEDYLCEKHKYKNEKTVVVKLKIEITETI